MPLHATSNSCNALLLVLSKKLHQNRNLISFTCKFHSNWLSNPRAFLKHFVILSFYLVECDERCSIMEITAPPPFPPPHLRQIRWPCSFAVSQKYQKLDPVSPFPFYPTDHHPSQRLAINGTSCLLPFPNPTTCRHSNLKSINLTFSLFSWLFAFFFPTYWNWAYKHL